MARRRKGLARKQLRVMPYFIVLLMVTGLLWLSAFAGVGFKSFPTPKLGLDLQGGMSMILSARLPDGGTPDAKSMEQARQIIEDRVNGTGVAEPEIYVEGTSNIVVNVAGQESDAAELREVGAPAELRFRQVIQGPVPDYTMQDPEDFAEVPEDEDPAEGEDPEDPTDGEDPEGEPGDELDASDPESPDEGTEDTTEDGEEPTDEEEVQDPADSDSTLADRREEVKANS